MTRRVVAGALCFVAISLLASAVQARQEYPGEVQAEVGMECPPPCLTCHTQATGGKNWNPFGIQFLAPIGEGKRWPELIASLRQHNGDTDKDGRSDIYELEHDTDPSVAGNDAINCVRYGCGARVAGDSAVDPTAAVASFFALGLLVLFRARSRARA